MELSGELYVVGTGLRIEGQVTQESLSAIRSADKLFHLIQDVLTHRWLAEINPTAESLFDAYAVGRPRRESYAEMTERILAPVRLRATCLRRLLWPSGRLRHAGACSHPARPRRGVLRGDAAGNFGRRLPLRRSRDRSGDRRLPELRRDRLPDPAAPVRSVEPPASLAGRFDRRHRFPRRAYCGTAPAWGSSRGPWPRLMAPDTRSSSTRPTPTRPATSNATPALSRSSSRRP